MTNEERDRLVAERRLARFRWDAEIPVLMGTGRFEVIGNPLPAGAELVKAELKQNVWAGGYADMLEFTLVHPSFAPIGDGAEPPLLDCPLLRRLSEVHP